MKKNFPFLFSVIIFAGSCHFYESWNSCCLTIYNTSHVPVWAACGRTGFNKISGNMVFGIYNYPIEIKENSFYELDDIVGYTWKDVFKETDSLILVFSETKEKIELWLKEKSNSIENIIIDTLLIEKMVLRKNDFDLKSSNKEIIYRGDLP